MPRSDFYLSTLRDATMQMLSEDDQNLRDMTAEELDAAWDLWFDLAQSTNDFDPPFTHGVFAGQERLASAGTDAAAEASRAPLRGAGLAR